MIKSLVLHIVGNAATLYFLTQFLPGEFVIEGGWRGFVIAGILFGILNTFIKPLLKILAFPIMLMTAGLFTFLINMFMVWFAKYALSVLAFEGVALLTPGGWVVYLYVGLAMAIANMTLHWLASK